MSVEHAHQAGAEIVRREIKQEPQPLPKKRGRPKRLPKQVAAIVALRLEGHSTIDIARALGLTPKTVRNLLYKAKRLGGFTDVLDRVDGIAVPQAVENLIDGLAQGDKDYTLEVLKGRGVFRNHSQVKNDGATASATAFVVKIELPQLPQGQLPPQATAGQIVGTPRLAIEGEVVPDAIQEPSAARVDVREQAGDGEAVGRGDTGGSDIAGARRIEDELDSIAQGFLSRSR